MKRFVFGMAITMLVLDATQNVDAAIITWGSPIAVNRFNESQVLNTGPFTSSTSELAATVNTVVFPNNLGLTTSNWSGGTGGGYPPYDTNYAQWLSGGLYRASGASATTTLSGLLSGTSYTIQVFTPYWDANYETQLISGPNTVNMGNTSSIATYVIGTFTATGTTQSFDWTAAPGSAYGLLAAAQIRVPEPSSLVLFAFGSVFLGFIKRRRGK